MAAPYIPAMTQRHLSLTEKEKETLRLLVQGYDAKSIARHLGLSVHTVNERLRDARRKMDTSSSREAARLLREAEGRTPELFGDKPFGDVTGQSPAQMSLQPAQGRGKKRRTGWIVGGLTMSITLALLSLASLTGADQAPGFARPASEQAIAATETAVVDTARHWLAQVDARDWQGAWNGTGSSFRLHNTQQNWADAAEQVHGKFGPAKSRELIVVEEVPSAPSGSWMVKFKASYANKPQGTETLLLAREDGVWKVLGIYVG